MVPPTPNPAALARIQGQEDRSDGRFTFGLQARSALTTVGGLDDGSASAGSTRVTASSVGRFDQRMLNVNSTVTDQT
jgi:hypothetical protein